MSSKYCLNNFTLSQLMSSKYCLNIFTLSQLKEAPQDHTIKPDNLYRTCMEAEVAHPLQQMLMEFSKPQPCYQEWLQANHTMGRTWQSFKPARLGGFPGRCSLPHLFLRPAPRQRGAGLGQANKGQ